MISNSLDMTVNDQSTAAGIREHLWQWLYKLGSAAALAARPDEKTKITQIT